MRLEGPEHRERQVTHARLAHDRLAEQPQLRHTDLPPALTLAVQPGGVEAAVLRKLDLLRQVDAENDAELTGLVIVVFPGPVGVGLLGQQHEPLVHRAWLEVEEQLLPQVIPEEPPAAELFAEAPAGRALLDVPETRDLPS
jgi:hypothetical protein